MNTKKIIWRLKEQPSTESLRELVAAGLLTKDEAREVLFSEVSEKEIKEGRDIDSLQSEVKFLRELVEKLSTGRSQIVKLIREIERPWVSWSWYKPYEIFCSPSLGFNAISTSTSGSTGLNSIASGGSNLTGCTSNFTDIKTF